MTSSTTHAHEQIRTMHKPVGKIYNWLWPGNLQAFCHKDITLYIYQEPFEVDCYSVRGRVLRDMWGRRRLNLELNCSVIIGKHPPGNRFYSALVRGKKLLEKKNKKTDISQIKYEGKMVRYKVRGWTGLSREGLSANSGNSERATTSLRRFLCEKKKVGNNHTHKDTDTLLGTIKIGIVIRNGISIVSDHLLASNSLNLIM